MLSRKVRLALSGPAVVLGVMFMSGSSVLTDTMGRSIEQVFTRADAGFDVDAHGKSKVDTQGAVVPIPTLLARIRSTPGVASATGIVQIDGVRVVGTNGKVVSGFGGVPRFGTNWTGTDEQVQTAAGA